MRPRERWGHRASADTRGTECCLGVGDKGARVMVRDSWEGLTPGLCFQSQ